MKQIKLNEIKMRNFKGFSAYEITFDKKNRIEAPNGAGKTTLFYAFQWVLGYDVPDVIPKENNNEMNDLKTEVAIEIKVNDLTYKLKRVQVETYTYVDELKVKSGNKSEFFVDDMKYTLNNYKQLLEDTLGISHDKLKIIINREYFNDVMDWKDRRKFLFDMVNIENLNSELVQKNDYELIQNDLLKGYEPSDIAKTIGIQMRGLKKEQEDNMVKIQEREEDVKEYSKINYKQLEKDKKEVESEKEKLQLSAKEASNSELISHLNKQYSEFLSTKNTLEREDIDTRNNLDKECNNIQRVIRDLEYNGKLMSSDIESNKDKIEELTVEKNKLSKIEFNESTTCSLCGQDLPKDQVKKLQDTFNEKQSKELSYIQSRIDDLVNQNNSLEEKRTVLRKEYTEHKEQLNSASVKLNEFKPNDKIKELDSQINAIREKINKIKTENSAAEIKDKIYELSRKAEEINKELNKKDYLEQSKSRIKALKEQNIKILDEMAELTDKKAVVEKFIKEQCNLIEKEINKKFSKDVSFSLFKQLLRGGTGGVEEVCVAMYKGKVYSSCSYGEKFALNLEIVKTIQDYLEIDFPIFLDNAESITIPYKANQQTIELFACDDSNISDLTIQKIDKEYSL